MAGRGATAIAPIAMWIVAAVAAIWFLREAKSLLIPIAIAILISYALEPVVAWLERHRIRRIIGAPAVLILVVGAILVGAYTLRDDALRFVEAIPKAAARAREFVTVQLGSGADALSNVADLFGGASAAGTTGGETANSAGQAGGSMVQMAASAIMSFAGHAVVIFFLVFFLLIARNPLKDRLVDAVGSDAEQRRMTVTIVDDINQQIQRYLLVLLLTAGVVGLSTWLVLAWIGAQHAAMWGLLAGLLNSIPFFGPVVVSVGLFIVGIVQGGGVSQAVQMSGAAIVITSLEGWLLTPALMGKAERMSALAVFLGLLLWTWIWGAWGTILAVPMLAIIKSVADHVTKLRPIGRLMSA